jgi:xanthine dehydrogenase accessory factor
MNEPLPNLLHRVLAIRAAGRSCFACLVVHSRGSTPQTAGALMVVDDALNTFGTIGGGCVEAEVRRRAFELMSRGQTGLLRFKLDHDYGWDDGLICGGTLEIAVAALPADDVLRSVLRRMERRTPTALDFVVDTDHGPAAYTLNIPARERLLIAGAGHVGQALARMALNLEFDVAVYDDRADLMERFVPAGAVRIAGEIAENLRAAQIDDQTYCVIVTRGHRHDEQALHAVIGRGARYVGMIGSRRKVKLIFDDLREMGASDQALLEVHAPIGLAIGAVSVEEIALSIAAQLVEVRRERSIPIVVGPRTAESKEARAEP